MSNIYQDPIHVDFVWSFIRRFNIALVACLLCRSHHPICRYISVYGVDGFGEERERWQRIERSSKSLNRVMGSILNADWISLDIGYFKE